MEDVYKYEALPTMSFAKGMVVCRQDGNHLTKWMSRGVVVSVHNVDIDPEIGEPMAFVQWELNDAPVLERQFLLWLDLEDPGGFGPALRLLGSRWKKYLHRLAADSSDPRFNVINPGGLPLECGFSPSELSDMASRWTHDALRDDDTDILYQALCEVFRKESR